MVKWFIGSAEEQNWALLRSSLAVRRTKSCSVLNMHTDLEYNQERAPIHREEVCFPGELQLQNELPTLPLHSTDSPPT